VGRLAAAAALLVLAGATACGERSEPTGPTAPLYPVTVQSDDRPLVARGPARRIAVLDQGARAIVRGLGVAGRIVLPPPHGRIDYDALRRARPDLVVTTEDLGDGAVDRAAAVTRAEIYTAPSDSMRQVERAIAEVGLLVGRPLAARRLVRRIETERRLVAVRLTHARSVRVFLDTGFFTTVSDQSLIGDVLRQAHATNVAGALAQSGPVDPGELLRLDPAVYLATSDALVTLRDLRRNPKTRRLPAVRAGRFHVVDASLLEPGPQVGDGLLEVARLLHPNAFR
jgi:ABC-type Fe3+-hydroxamate transport system substrate-binding protein